MGAKISRKLVGAIMIASALFACIIAGTSIAFLITPSSPPPDWESIAANRISEGNQHSLTMRNQLILQQSPTINLSQAEAVLARPLEISTSLGADNLILVKYVNSTSLWLIFANSSSVSSLSEATATVLITPEVSPSSDSISQYAQQAGMNEIWIGGTPMLSLQGGKHYINATIGDNGVTLWNGLIPSPVPSPNVVQFWTGGYHFIITSVTHSTEELVTLASQLAQT